VLHSRNCDMVFRGDSIHLRGNIIWLSPSRINLAEMSIQADEIRYLLLNQDRHIII